MVLRGLKRNESIGNKKGTLPSLTLFYDDGCEEDRACPAIIV